ncbi:MAG: hypothetical protein OXI40_16190 [Chloroflexota bacterium]|nr:hypothetical protein [Chloroflexota bacterium]
MARRLLFSLILFQVLTHLFWLSPAAHSGQLAIPWMMNRGKTLFADIWEQHAPGSSLLGAAAQALLPMDPALLIKVLNTVLVVALTLLIYRLATVLGGKPSTGALAALYWVWWEPVYGNIMLYFDTLLALCALLALIVYYQAEEGPTLKRIALTGALMGALMGAATLFKQHAWLAVALVGLWLIFTEGRRSALVYALAALALPGLQWLALAAGGLWDSYIFWNWTFNLHGFMDGVPLDGDLFRKLLLGNLLVFPFALLALRRGKRRLLLLLLVWLAALTVLYPRFGEIHGMGQLPFAAVMSGLVLAWTLPQITDPRRWQLSQTVLAGLALGVGVGWLWTGAVTYIPTALGPGATLGYDEFDEAVAQLLRASEAEDTLFVLPETDSTPQLHARSGLLPPGAWIKGWRWYFRPDFVLPALIDEWETQPPTWVVVFPDMLPAGEPGIAQLLAIVQRDYQLRFTVDGVFDHGPAQVYRSPT